MAVGDFDSKNGPDPSNSSSYLVLGREEDAPASEAYGCDPDAETKPNPGSTRSKGAKNE